MAQVTEHLPGKHRAVSLNTSTTTTKNKTKQNNQKRKEKQETSLLSVVTALRR
jgi:hypothetical protein